MADAPQFKYYAASAPDLPGYTRIYDPNGVLDPLPPQCGRGDPEGQPDQNSALCEDGGTAPSLTTLDLMLGDGDDQPSIQQCFGAVTVNVGGGINETVVPNCLGGTFSWTSGAGKDTLTVAPGSTAAIDATLGGGRDEFKGRGGASVVDAGAGNDNLTGGSGDDKLLGGAGRDSLTGGKGRDRLFGEAGVDELTAKDGIADFKIDCGSGSNNKESARRDKIDPPAINC